MMEGTVVSENATIIRVAAICGSLRRASFNRGLIRYAKKLCEEDISGMHVEFVDIGSLPLLNTDLEIDGGYPPVVDAFRRKILEADSILFASPEYNYSLSAPLKNAIDWASRPPNVMAGKTAAVVSAAGGSAGQRSQYHLRQVGVFLDLHFINKPELFILGHKPPKKFDSDGNLIDSEIKQRLKELLLSLQSFTCRLQRAPLKNAIDWASRPPNVMAGKSAAVVSAAGGSAGQRSQYHLRQVGVFLDLHFINKPELFILGHKPPKKFDSDGNLIDSEIKQRLKELLLSLQSFTCRLQRGNTIV